MPSPGGQFLSDEFGDIEEYFISDYWLIDQYIGDTLWTWGLNTDGQLGTNDITQRNTPVTTFSGGTNWKQVSSSAQNNASTGVNHAAIKTDGTLWVWGASGSGKLGINTTGIDKSTPVTTFAGGTDWKQVSVGNNHTAAIKTDGTLWTWGLNADGQLGINDGITRSTPVTTFAGGTNWKSVSAGYECIAAIKTDGTLWTWGRGGNGQLGVNNTTNRTTPVTTFAGGNNWKLVDCGVGGAEGMMVAIKTDGTLWLWGDNGNGRLGINVGQSRSTPVTTFAGGTDWKYASFGSAHVAAIKTDGTLWTWGSSGSGRLGIGAPVDKSTPVTTFAGGTNWKYPIGGFLATSAIKTDGTLWVWGDNTSAKLGTNDTTSRSTPVTTFAGGTNWKQADLSRSGIAIQAGLNVDFS